MKLSAKAQASLDKVVARFQEGDLSPLVQASIIPLADDAPARKWSYSNRVLAFAQSNCLDCRGYRQWQKAGRQVQKGERASFILVPRLVKGEKDGEDKMELRGFLTAAVFGYSQTDGEDIDYEPKSPPPLAEVAERMGVSIAFSPFAGSALGSINPDGTQVTLSSHDVKTWFHELGHAVHSKLNGKLKGGQDEHQEAVAELASAVLMELYGYGDISGNCWKYVSGYSTDPLKAIMGAAQDVEQILAVIMEE